jgi:hypothetical protein
MEETEIVNCLNDLYGDVMGKLTLAEDEYSPYDAENELYLIEIKSRDTKYRSWVIQEDKYKTNLALAAESGRKFIYLNEYKGSIHTWNITDLTDSGYDFQWKEIPMPKTTEFEDTNTITKVVGFLYEGVAKIHKEKE